MALNYTQLVQLVEDYLQQYDTTFTGDINYIILQAEDRISKDTLLPVFKKNATSNCIPSSRFISAPTDMLSPLALTLIQTDGTYTPLLVRDPSLIYEMWGDTTTGPPQYYSLYSDATFLLGPTPDQSYGMEFQYFYKPSSITVNPPGTSWLGTNAENCLLYACLLEAYIYMKGDVQLMQNYLQSYQHAIQQLQRLGEGLDQMDAFSSNEIKIPVPK